MGRVASLDQALTASSATAQHAVGALYESADGKLYKYVLLDASTVATVLHNVCYYLNAAHTEVTSDITDALTDHHDAAGVFLAASQTDAHYIWIQISGVGNLVNHDSALAATNSIVAHNADGVVDLMAAGEENEVIARSLAATHSTTFATVALLYFPH